VRLDYRSNFLYPIVGSNRSDSSVDFFRCCPCGIGYTLAGFGFNVSTTAEGVDPSSLTVIMLVESASLARLIGIGYTRY
jgi:hypothetical protein